jgi:hypothetical protein
MIKRPYVKRAIGPQPEEISLEEFNRNLLHLAKTKPNKKNTPPPVDPEKEK